MRKYSTEQLLDYLAAVDRRLAQTFDLVVIGGAAAMLAYGVERATQDIDTWHADFEAIRVHLDAARQETGFSVFVHHAAVADAPYDFMSRLVRLDRERLVKLRISVPEKHDLVLMKAVRSYEHDLQACEAIHERFGLELETLLQRFLTEMGHVVADPERLDGNMLALVGRLFGAREAARVEPRIRARRG